MARTPLATANKLLQASGRRRRWTASSPPRSCSARMRLARRRRSSSASLCGDRKSQTRIQTRRGRLKQFRHGEPQAGLVGESDRARGGSE